MQAIRDLDILAASSAIRMWLAKPIPGMAEGTETILPADPTQG